MNVLEKKIDLRPVNYPEFKEAYEKSLFSHWSHHELNIEPDILDWVDRLNDAEKSVIGNLFKAFTGAEGIIGCNWKRIAQTVGQPEIVAMADVFSHEEAIHGYAYDFLEAHLPMDEVITKDWHTDPVAQKKMETIMSFSDIENFITAVAAFAFVEGVSLYSSFATLMAFTKKGYLKSMYQVMLWSVLQEANHSKMAIKLVKTMIAEGLGVLDEEKCYELASLIVENEKEFVKNAFGDTPSLGFVTVDQSLSFIDHRGNLKLMELGLKPIFPYTKEYKPLANFFYTSLEGKTVNDFFAVSRNGTGYSNTITQKFESCNFGGLDGIK